MSGVKPLKLDGFVKLNFFQSTSLKNELCLQFSMTNMTAYFKKLSYYGSVKLYPGTADLLSLMVKTRLFFVVRRDTAQGEYKYKVERCTLPKFHF